MTPWLQSCRDTLGLGTEISFNVETHNRENTNAMSSEEKERCRLQALHGSERSCTAERLEGSKGACTKLFHDTQSIAHYLNAAQRETGHSRSDLNV